MRASGFNLTAMLLFFVACAESATSQFTSTTCPGPKEQVKQIMMGANAYQPSELSIKKGTCVEFINQSGTGRWPASNIHPDHRVYPEFDPKMAVPDGQTWSFVFDKAGSWRMHDHLDPTIHGVINVTE